MKWIGLAVSGALLGAVAHKTGFDETILRTLINYGSSFFLYILAKVIDLLCWFVDMIPPLTFTADYIMGLENIIVLVGQLNNFFPVVELFVMIFFTIIFIIAFVAFKLIYKAIPTVG